MTNYQTIDAVELSQDELNMVEGGTLCLAVGLLGLGVKIVGGVLGALAGGFGGSTCPAPTPTPCPPPKPAPCPK